MNGLHVSFSKSRTVAATVALSDLVSSSCLAGQSTAAALQGLSPQKDQNQKNITTERHKGCIAVTKDKPLPWTHGVVWVLGRKHAESLAESLQTHL